MPPPVSDATVTIVQEAALRRAIGLDLDTVACVADAFARLAAGGVRMPPILRLDLEDARGEVDVKTAYVPGIDSFAIKISPGFFDNPTLGLPSVNGLMTLFSAKTGLIEAVMLDNGYLTDIRTAAAGAVAIRHLAIDGPVRLGVLGAGVQARLQAEAAALVRPVSEVVLWARDPAKAAIAAEDLHGTLAVPVRVATVAADAATAVDVLITTTPAETPLVTEEMLHPGLTIVAMGSDAEHKNEVAPRALAKADRYVPDSREQTARLGELHHALKAGLIAPDAAFPSLGAIVAGTAPGRENDRQTIVADLTGTGVQDTAIATLARRRLDTAGAGQRLPLF